MTGTAGRLQPASILPSLADESGLLVVRLRSIGDIVLLTPALALLKRWRADLKISVLVESRFSQLLEASPDIDRIIVYPRPFSWKTNRRAGLRDFLGKVSELRREKFQVIVNLHGGPTSALLTAASGARRRVGFAHYPNGFLYHVRVPDASRILGQEVVHTAEHQASAFFLARIAEERSPAATALPAGRVERSGTGQTAACGSRAGSALCGSPPAGALCHETVAAGTIRRDGKDAGE